MRRVISVLVVLLIFLSGIGLLLYPVLRGRMQDTAMRRTAERFLATFPTITEQPPAEPSSSEIMQEPQPTEPREPDPLRRAMEDHNDRLRREQAAMWGKLNYDRSPIRLEDYGITDGICAVLEIPRLGLVLPVYLGASDSNLRQGAAVVGWSSMPIGGTGTCCVIAAHRSYKGAAFFGEIDKLEPGDAVIFTNRWETLRYQVVAAKVTDPADMAPLSIRQDADLLVLYTCHPMYSTRQRLLVVCSRNDPSPVLYNPAK